MLSTLGNKPPGTIIDMGAKYAKMRSYVNSNCPNHKYIGVRAPASEADKAYISANAPHSADMIVKSYDEFYANFVPPEGNVYFIFVDSIYYVTAA